MIGPGRDTQISAPRQMLADASDRCVENRIPGQVGLRIDHVLPPFWIHLEIVQETGD
jgi:hypothetical protein